MPSGISKPPSSGSRPSCCARTFATKAGRPGPPPTLRWLAEVVCPTPAQQLVFQGYLRAVTEQYERLGRLESELHDHVASPYTSRYRARISGLAFSSPTVPENAT